VQSLSELVNLLNLEQFEVNLFRGQSYKTAWGRVFGGQVLAQSLHAATRTVPVERKAHSIHAYFILPGDINLPIIYDVERIRDGGSFTTRRVVAIQKGRPIFNMAASFQLEQEGLSHQIPMPKVPGPESLATDVEVLEGLAEVPRQLKIALVPRPIEFRPVESFEEMYFSGRSFRHVWMKAKDVLPNDSSLHQQIMAYTSDYNLLSTALLPHTQRATDESMQLASLDHAMWFHRDFRIDEWLLYALDSPSSSNTRGFTRGSFFKQDGTLVASVVQEGLMRVRQAHEGKTS